MVDQALASLTDRLAEDYVVADWGYAQFGDLAAVEQRALVSDQLLSSVDAIATNLRDARGHVNRVVALHGPNGRAMPDPGQPSEAQAMHELDREVAAAFRAIGSVLDCLAAAVIPVLRIPNSIQHADANGLWRLRKLASGPDAPEVWRRVSDVFELHRGGLTPGWLEWTVETRNAVVHRARLLRMWLPKASQRRPGDPQLFVASDLPEHRLVRYELHLRRSPWEPDMQALSAKRRPPDQWLLEPAPDTLGETLVRLAALVEDVCEQLILVWSDVATGAVELASPAGAWALKDPTPGWRVQAATAFSGYGPSAVPSITSIVMHSREAKRAALAEELRRRA